MGLSAVQIAMQRIKVEIPNGDKLIQRPNDFYAEMIKTDNHMKKIKGRILWEQKRIGIVENRKKNKRLKQYHKQLMSNKIAENAKRQSGCGTRRECRNYTVSKQKRTAFAHQEIEKSCQQTIAHSKIERIAEQNRRAVIL